jgi:hypothetical protein
MITGLTCICFIQQLITAEDLYAISQESETAYYFLPELCALAGLAYPLVVPPPDTSKRDALPDPLNQPKT